LAPALLPAICAGCCRNCDDLAVSRGADHAGQPSGGFPQRAGDIFVFRAKRADRMKLLYWDGTGLCLFPKRPEQGRFAWPPVDDGTIRLSAELGLLLEDLDWSRGSVAVESHALSC